MPNLLLEKKILGAILNDLNLLNRAPLKANWFSEKEHRNLAYTLIDTDKQFRDMSEVEAELKNYYPKSLIDEEWLQMAKFEEVNVKDYRASVHALEEQHTQDKLQEASYTYADYPSEKNREQVHYWLRVLDELEQVEDDGSLDDAIDSFIYELENEVEEGIKTFPMFDKMLGAGIEGGQLIVIGARPGMGKGHPNWLEIPTPKGTKKFGELRTGDYVFDRYGKPTKITGVYPRGKLETYKVTLNDGRSTIVDGDHIWSHFSMSGSGNESLINKTTREMYESGTHLKKKRKNGKFSLSAKYSIPTNEAVEFKKRELAIDPYVIGALVGDGCLLERRLTISTDDEYVVKKIADELNVEPFKQPYNNFSWNFKLKEQVKNKKYLQTKDILSDFDSLTTYSHLKSIPKDYLFSSSSDRMRLLNGLFDTDGHAALNGKKLSVGYTTTSKKLAEQIRWLLQSCGYLSGLTLDDREGRRVCYNINVLGQPGSLTHLFTLPTKKNVVESYAIRRKRKYDRIAIKSIEKTGKCEEITCISVENEEQLYLCNDFIVTHNTAYAINLAYQALIKKSNGDTNIDFFTLEMTKKQMLKRFTSTITGINSYKFRNASLALNNDEKKSVIEGVAWLKKTGLRIHDKRMSLSDIEHVIRQRHFDEKSENDENYMAVIDYLGLVNSGQERLPRHEQIGVITRKLKLLSNELDIPIILLTQLNRSVETRDDKTPNLSDIRDSGTVEQDANVVAFLSEDTEMSIESYGDTPAKRVIDLTIQKNREGAMGQIKYEFDKSAMKFTELMR